MALLRFLTRRIFFIHLFLALIFLGVLFFSIAASLKEITRHNVSVKVPQLKKMPIQKAEALLEEMGLTLEVDSANFIEQHKPFEVLDQSPIAGQAVKPGRLIFLRVNPRTHRPSKMPDILHKSYRLAQIYLSLLKLNIGQITYEPYFARDVVIKMFYNGRQIASGDPIPRNASVDLVLGQGYIDVHVPSLSGLLLDSAHSVLERNLFGIGQIEYLQTQNRDSATVVYQIPEAGDVFTQGQPINVWLTDKKDSIREKIINNLKQSNKVEQSVLDRVETHIHKDIREPNFDKASVQNPSKVRVQEGVKQPLIQNKESEEESEDVVIE